MSSWLSISDLKCYNVAFIVIALFLLWKLLKWLIGNDPNDTSLGMMKVVKFIFGRRNEDLVKFCNDHDELFKEAKKTGDHAAVTAHFYDLMGAVIECYYGPNWHFAAPTRPGQGQMEAVKHLHHLIARLLQLAPGKKALDIGSGMGGMIHDLVHYSGADVTGLTLSTEEVDRGNILFRQVGLDILCRIIQGDAQEMKPFEASQFDAAYAVYALKYFTSLDRVFKHANRVLKPGSYFLIYDIIKTLKYDENDPEHVKVVADFEYSCGMPSLHTQKGMIDDAAKAGFECLTQMETSQQTPWYYEFDQPLFRWMLTSKVVQSFLAIAETVRILPKGFRRFYNIFISGNVMGIVNGGKMGILSGGIVLVFRKK